jgi:hypothetical protein
MAAHDEPPSWHQHPIVEAADENEKLRTALRSIAANTCCDRCQEAALVALSALGEKE